MRLDYFASRDHYAAHAEPVWAALPARMRGERLDKARYTANPVLVASYIDLRSMRPFADRLVLMEHGAGQSYGGARSVFRDNPSYVGGRDREVDLLLVPNAMAAERSLARYPDVPTEIVGNPRLASLPRGPAEGRVLAVSFHWHGAMVPEMDWAFTAYRYALRALANDFTILGHAHPLVFDKLEAWYRRNGIEPVRDFAEVCERANLYMVDNSSTLYEFAATDRPVVVLNIDRYRRDVEHGLRFWQYANVGVQCDHPSKLRLAVERALSDPIEVRAERRAAVAAVYPYRTPARAVKVLRDYFGGIVPEAPRMAQDAPQPSARLDLAPALSAAVSEAL